MTYFVTSYQLPKKLLPFPIWTRGVVWCSHIVTLSATLQLTQFYHFELNVILPLNLKAGSGGKTQFYLGL